MKWFDHVRIYAVASSRGPCGNPLHRVLAVLHYRSFQGHCVRVLRRRSSPHTPTPSPKDSERP